MNDKIDWFEQSRRRLKAKLSPELRASLRQWFVEPMAKLYAGNLIRLAQIHGSDKWAGHWYCSHYARHFARLRKKKITLLEIGIGGYADPKSGGGSLRMWRTYFSYGHIYGIDIADKRPHNERRIGTFQGDQSDEKFLHQVIAQIGKPDIIIDDGSHLNSHVIKTFQILFPLLADEGIYVVEDTQTSYWPHMEGSSDDFTGAPTSMCFLKGLTDGLNHAEYIRPGYVPSYFDTHIVSAHFYHNLVFIHKGKNDEGSIQVKNNLPCSDEA